MLAGKYILLTFDYEIFMGKTSGSVDNCMIMPTERLLEVLGKYNAQSIFFIDTVYLYVLEKQAAVYPKAKADLDKIHAQLKTIAGQGHIIAHHIHPHWLDAVYSPESNNWDCTEKSRFSIVNLNAAEKETIISYSDSVVKKYNTTGFLPYRAGGFFMQPFDEVKDVLSKYNIVYDFSVMRDYRCTGYNNYYSFNYNNPPKKYIYNISNDLLKEDREGPFTEVSVNHYTLSGINKIANAIYYRMNKGKGNTKWGDGKSSGNIITGIAYGFPTKYLKATILFSIDDINPVIAGCYVQYLKKNNFIHFLSHPKLFSEQGLAAFDVMLAKATKKFNIIFDPLTVIKDLQN